MCEFQSSNWPVFLVVFSNLLLKEEISIFQFGWTDSWDLVGTFIANHSS